MLWVLELLILSFVFFFITVQELLGISILQFVGHLLCGSMVGLMTTSSKKTYATHSASQVCCSQSHCPHSRPLLTHASAGDTQSLKSRSVSVSVGSLGPIAHKTSLPLDVGYLLEVAPVPRGRRSGAYLAQGYVFPKLYANDYITTIYRDLGHVSP